MELNWDSMDALFGEPETGQEGQSYFEPAGASQISLDSLMTQSSSLSHATLDRVMNDVTHLRSRVEDLERMLQPETIRPLFTTNPSLPGPLPPSSPNPPLPPVPETSEFTSKLEQPESISLGWYRRTFPGWGSVFSKVVLLVIATVFYEDGIGWLPDAESSRLEAIIFKCITTVSNAYLSLNKPLILESGGEEYLICIRYWVIGGFYRFLRQSFRIARAQVIDYGFQEGRAQSNRQLYSIITKDRAYLHREKDGVPIRFANEIVLSTFRLIFYDSPDSLFQQLQSLVEELPTLATTPVVSMLIAPQSGYYYCASAIRGAMKEWKKGQKIEFDLDKDHIWDYLKLEFNKIRAAVDPVEGMGNILNLICSINGASWRRGMRKPVSVYGAPLSESEGEAQT